MEDFYAEIDGIKIVESWIMERGMLFHPENTKVVYMNPEDAVTLCIATKEFDAALDKLKTVIHYKIDHGYYGRGKRA